MRNIFEAVTLLPLVAAWPTAMDRDSRVAKRGQAPNVPAPNFKSGRDNCGAHGPCAGFNAAEQYVDVSPGSGHEFQSPSSTDERGECPGLNAAANHGFLPRNGIATMAQTIEGLGAAYSMDADLAEILAVVAIALAGDPVAETWSIGGPYKPATSLQGTPSGILGTHNRYEGDASIVRGDAYLHGGNVGVFEMQKWEYLYSLVGDNLTHDDAGRMAYWTSEYSVLNNPYYFSAPFSGLVAPDAHNFVVNMMSNHSAEVPGGTLDAQTLMSFFAVTGEPGNFVHNEGQERIPDNWYKRPLANAFTAVDTNVDTAINDAIYPGVIRFGGNTGKTNSFAGIDTGDLTGGVYNSANLLEGNQLTCFFLQATSQGLLDFAAPLLVPEAQLLALLNKYISPQMSALSCPQLSAFNDTFFQPYPGANYKAQGE